METSTQTQNAVAYVRVSSSRQVTDGNSLVVQRDQVERYCQSKNYKLTKIWIEEAETAKSDDRPLLQSMLRQLTKNPNRVQVLVIPKLDRLARNSIDYGGIKKILKAASVRVESCTEALEDSPVGRLTESLLASIAQFDNEVRAERSKGGMIQAVKEGRWVWRPPLGYRSTRVNRHAKKGGLGTVEPDPSAARLVSECFKRIASKQQSVAEVRRWLARRGVSLSLSSMHHLLQNPLYCGVIRAFGADYEAAPPLLPIVSRERFELVQRVISSTKKCPSKYDIVNEDYPLRGSLRCPKCNRCMSSCWSQGRSKRFPYYRCCYCPKVNLSRDKATQAFFVELAEFIPTERLFQIFKRRVERLRTRTLGDRQERASTLAKEIKRIREVRSSLATKSAEGVIPDDVAKEELARHSAQLGELQEQMSDLTSDHGDIVAILKFGVSFLENLPWYWSQSEVNQQQKLQSFFFPEGIVLEKDYSLRTDAYPLLEQVKSALCGHKYRLVDPNSEMPNRDERILEWLETLYEEFRDEPNEGR